MKTRPIRILSLLLLAFLLCGCAQESDALAAETVATVSKPEQRLLIHVTQDEEGFSSFSPEELGGNYDSEISYHGLRDVTIDLDGESWKLEEAIRDGRISVDEIIAYARMDVKNGYCTQSAKSKNGLTRLAYCYPEFKIFYVYDIYETPDGKSHLIKDFGLYLPGANPAFFYIDDETGERIDYEDWGLTFEAVETSPTSITLSCTQSGGQQLGDLVLESYWLCKPGTDPDSGEYTEELIDPLVMDVTGETDPNLPIPGNAETTIPLDLSLLYGELPAGDYLIYLSVKDEYDKDAVHPLMKNFYDRQYYAVAFTVE